MLEKIFDAIMSSDFGSEINLSACEKHEHFIVLQFWDGRRHMLTCPFLDNMAEPVTEEFKD
jgi:hypothetical protein